MSRITTLQDVKNRELVDGEFFKQEVKKYEELCLQLARDLKQSKIKNFSNEHYIKELEENYKDAIKKLKELNYQQRLNITRPTEGSKFIQNMKDYLTKDLGLNEQDIQKIKEENLKKIQSFSL